MKIDINIERDLAYALKAKDCPQILFLRGNRILHREQGKITCAHILVWDTMFCSVGNAEYALPVVPFDH